MELIKLLKQSRRLWLWLPAVMILVLAGCASDTREAYDPLGETTAADSGSTTADAANYTLRVGDSLTVTFYDINPPVPAITDEIKDDGTITLIQNEHFKAAGLTISQLQTNVYDRYVPSIYRIMTVNIVPANRVYTVTGEVRQEGQKVYPGHMTVLEAIANAEGFTDYAAKRRVVVTRARTRKQIHVDCIKAQSDPTLNIEIFPGDTILVKHTIF